MSIVPFVTGGLLLVSALFSLRRITLLPLPPGRRMLLALLRIVLISAIALAFFEPVLTFDRLSSSRQPVPVLIDASQSMSLFLPDQTTLPVLKKLGAWNARHSDPAHRFVFYRFGDSLRRQPDDNPDNSPAAFTDHRSFLPMVSQDAALRRATSVLLISDGNWSNTILPAEAFSDKNARYLPLPGIHPSPFLGMEITGMPEASFAESLLTARFTLDGYSAIAGGETLSVSVAESNVRVAARAVAVPEGAFHIEESVPFPPRRPGRHLYRFCAQSKGGDRRCSRYALHTALPGHFFFSMMHAAPSLDERFIRLAFHNDRDFLKFAPDTRRAVDLAIVFDADKQLTAAPENLKPGGSLLFIGTFPGADKDVPAGISNTFQGSEREDFGKNPLADLDLARLPPASGYSINLRNPPNPSTVFLSACVSSPGSAKIDTLPIIFSFDWAGHHALACAASGIWRWDMAPLALSGAEDQALGFSRRFVAWVKDMLVNRLSDRLLLYPSGVLSEIDSLPLRVVFPADLAIPSEVRLSCRCIADRFKFDTSIAMITAGGSHQSLKLKPLPAGSYRLEAGANSGSREFTYVDSLFIDRDQSEYSIPGQNTALLRELAQPLSDFSDSSLAAVFFTGAQGADAHTRETFPIRRDWPLFALILLVLSAEWVTRRVFRLD